MAKYFYNKYTVIEDRKYGENTSGWSESQYLNADIYKVGYVSPNNIYSLGGYSWDPAIQRYTIIASKKSPQPNYVYIPNGSSTQVQQIQPETVQSGPETYYKFKTLNAKLLSSTSIRGTLIETITAEGGEYPVNGIQGSYWYVRGSLVNSSPTISGTDANLGNKNETFTVSYKVSDGDGDRVRITEKLNGITLRTLENAPQNESILIDISNEQLYSIPLNDTNTIEIRAEDSKGAISYRRFTFKRINTPPIIDGTNRDLGEKTEPFSIDFSATDVENSIMKALVYVDDKLKEVFENIGQGVTKTFELKKLDFLQLTNGRHTIRIEVTDAEGATAIRNITFTRKVDKLSHTSKVETDAKASRILVIPTYFLAEGAIFKVMACNNANDDVPTWEDITEETIGNQQHAFTNATKTADTWAVGVKIEIERGTATERSYLSGYGGAFN